jgi:hypothetical protein
MAARAHGATGVLQFQDETKALTPAQRAQLDRR